jgi:hypothetical protein
VIPLKCRHFVVGTRFCASAARPNAGNTALERQPLPVPLTAFQRDPAKKSPLERNVIPGSSAQTMPRLASRNTGSSTRKRQRSPF